jgi:flagellin
MLGPMSSSLALAQRTAEAAGARLSRVSDQIASGRKVASVKDDGAAWIRAQSLKSQKVEVEAYNMRSDYIKTSIVAKSAYIEKSIEYYNEALSHMVALTNPSLTASQRQTLTLEFETATFIAQDNWQTAWYALNPEQDAAVAMALAYPTVKTPGGGVTTLFSNAGSPHHYYDTRVAEGADFRYTNAGGTMLQNETGVGPGKWRPLVNNAAEAVAAAGYLRTALDGMRKDWGVTNSSINTLELLDSQFAMTDDRLDSAIGSLTDADLGKLSTQNQQAQTRQQLALDTIKTAISAYGNYAGGLLGNIQRTQSRVMA